MMCKEAFEVHLRFLLHILSSISAPIVDGVDILWERNNEQ